MPNHFDVSFIISCHWCCYTDFTETFLPQFFYIFRQIGIVHETSRRRISAIEDNFTSFLLRHSRSCGSLVSSHESRTLFRVEAFPTSHYLILFIPAFARVRQTDSNPFRYFCKERLAAPSRFARFLQIPRLNTARIRGRHG